MHFFVLNTAFLMYILCSKLGVFNVYIYLLSSAFMVILCSNDTVQDLEHIDNALIM